MNVKLQHVIADITGKTGMDIIEAIAGGNGTLGRWRDCATDQGRRGDHRQVAAGALAGGAELTQALELYRVYQANCRVDREIEAQLERFEDRATAKAPNG